MVDRVATVGIGQDVYLSTEIAKPTEMARMQVVDRASTEGHG